MNKRNHLKRTDSLYDYRYDALYVVGHLFVVYGNYKSKEKMFVIV